MIPLWTTTMWPVQSRCGWAFLLGRPAVGGPSRVPDPIEAIDGLGADGAFKVDELPGRAAQGHPFRVDYRDAG